jgi:YHS domain-containing protein
MSTGRTRRRELLLLDASFGALVARLAMTLKDCRWCAVVVLVAGTVFGLATGQDPNPPAAPAAVPRSDSPPPRLADDVDDQRPVVDRGLLSQVFAARPAEAAGGRDVVALVLSNEVVPGRKNFSSEFDGQTYLFSDAGHKAEFDANPRMFAPVLSGYSVVAYKDGGRLAAGSIDHRSLYDGRLYLFASAEEKRAFDEDPAAFEEADLVLQGFSPVSLVEDELLRRGDGEFELVFEGRRVRLADAKEKEAFLAAPARYFPTLGGIDPVSVADGDPQFGQARYSAVYKNRLYAMASEENRRRFLADAGPHSDLDVVDGGRDPVALVDERTERDGHYAISAIYRGQRYLFADEANRSKFLQDPARYDRERRARGRG